MKKFTFIFLGLWAVTSVQAIELTEAQKIAIRTDANSQPSLQICIAAGNDGCIADFYNSASTKVVWKTSVDQSMIYNDLGFAWSEVDGLTVGKRDEWKMLFWNGNINPSKANQVNAIKDVWTGTTAKNNVQAAILATCKRFATKVEALFATGTGTTAVPAQLAIEGTLSVDQLPNILRP